MNDLLIQKIRKLLRLAKIGGPEGLIAAERSQYLMEKHRISVTLDESIRQIIPGVTGSFWREQILVSVARNHRCKVLQSTDETTAVLAGERGNVGDARELYNRLCTELIVRCSSAWIRFVPRLQWAEQERVDADGWTMPIDRIINDNGWAEIIGEDTSRRRNYLSAEDIERLADDSYDPAEGAREVLGELISKSPAFQNYIKKRKGRAKKQKKISPADIEHVIKPVFYSVYLINAANQTAKRLGVGAKEPEPTYAPPPLDLNMPKRKPKQRQLSQADMAESLLKELKELVPLIGTELALQLQGEAESSGLRAGSYAYLVPRTMRFLAADGSIPRPVPTRFTYLDFE